MKQILRQIVIFILQKEAQAVLKKNKPQIVAVTGTVGKTSTKDAIYTALSNFYVTRKSQKSFNSEFGVPLTILGIQNISSVNVSLDSFFFWLKVILKGIDLVLLPSFYPEWLVLEIGADHPGDIQKITKWIKPDVTVITKLSKTPVHVEFFSSVEEVFEEKGYLVRALKPGGVLILNADDEDVLSYKNLSEEKVILFGNTPDADIEGSDYQVIYDENKLAKGIKFEVRVENESYPIILEETLGSHHAYHILAALAVVKAVGESVEIASKNMGKHKPTPGRMRLLPGIKNTLVIDDSYNSSPVAVTEALNALNSLKAKRKIAVLGDMLELGKYSRDAHAKVGEEVEKVTDILVTVGVRARTIADSALDFGMDESAIFQFDDSQEAGEFLQNIIKKGDVILVKGSQGVRMEKIVAEIMAEPENREELLVRQDGFWKSK